jgi:VCBS repeat-containing protein
MKKFFYSAIVMIFIIGCGGSTSTTTSTSTDNSSASSPSQYPTVNKTTRSEITNEETNLSEEYNATTPLTPYIINRVIERNGYSFDSFNLESVFRGEVNYEKYMYFSSKSMTVAILGNYVYAIKDQYGKKILFTLDGPSDFDAIEKSSELILRANFNNTAAKLRYVLPFAPIGYVNLNTTDTNPNATVATLLRELKYAFNQFTLTNPYIQGSTLGYRADSNGEDTKIRCNGVSIPLSTSEQTIDLSSYLEAQSSRIDCKTKDGVLIGSIGVGSTTETIDLNETNETYISGDLYQRITSQSPQVEGVLYSSRANLPFVANKITGQYGFFEISTTGEWIYEIDVSSALLGNIDLTQDFVESFNVETSDGASATVKIALGEATVDVGDILEGVDYIKGNIFSSDANETLQAQTFEGSYGKLQLNKDGTWRYDLNNDLSLVKSLNHGDTLTDLFNITSDIDVEITILGQDTLILGTVSGSVIEDVRLSVGGLVHIEYSNNATFEPLSVSGKYGTFTLNAQGEWHYELRKLTEIVLKLTSKDTMKDEFSIATTDGVTTTVWVNVVGVDSEILGDLSGSLSNTNSTGSSTNTINGKIYIERGINNFQKLHTNGSYGLFNLSTNGEWYYTLDLKNTKVQNLDSSTTLYDRFNIYAIDNTTKEIEIEIHGSNIPLTLYTKTFDALKAAVESHNKEDTTIIFPKITASGDAPKITYLFNNKIVSEGSEILLKGDQKNTIEIIVEESKGDYESKTLSKVLTLTDTTPPEPPTFDAPQTTTTDTTSITLFSTEDNVKIYLDGKYIETLANGKLGQKISLDTSGGTGLKSFKFTLQDIWDNESGSAKVEIQKINSNNPTDFDNVEITHSTGYAAVRGHLYDADGIKSVKVSYDNGFNAFEDKINQTDYDFEGEYAEYNTTYVIEVTDLLGKVETKSGTFLEPDNFPTDFSDVRTKMIDSTEGKLEGSNIYDNDGISSVVITYDDNLSDSYTSGYIDIAPAYPYGTEYNITVTDGKGVVSTFEGKIEQYDEPTDFSALNNSSAVGTFNVAGDIYDFNGIDSVKIFYDGVEESNLSNAGVETLTIDKSVDFSVSEIKIEVKDMLGEVKTHIINVEAPADNPTDFSSLSLDYSYMPGSGTIEGNIKDPDGIDSVTVLHDGTQEFNASNSGGISYYLYDTPIEYNTTVTIEIKDTLGNIKTHLIEVEEPIHHATDFSNVLLGDNNGTSGYLFGTVNDDNGITGIDVYYNGSYDRYINGDGNVSVALDAANFPAQAIGTTYKLKVYDKLGDFAEHNGTIVF